MSAADLKADSISRFKTIADRFGIKFIIRIDKQMQGLLADAGLPIEPLTVRKTKRGGYIRGLDKIAIDAGHAKTSEVWHAANIVEEIGALRRAIQKGLIEEIVHNALNLGIACGVAQVEIGAKPFIVAGHMNLVALNAARNTSAKNRAAEAIVSHEPIIEAAKRRWRNNPHLSAQKVAALIAKERGGGSVGYLRKVISAHKPKKVGHL